MTTALTQQQQSDLRACEQVIVKGLSTFREVGQALTRIRDERLYREDFATFDAYCKDRFGFSRQRASQLICCVKMEKECQQPVDNESQARKARQAAHHPTVADDFDDDDQDASGGAEPVTSGQLAGTEPDPAGVSSEPTDRIEWVVDQIGLLWKQYQRAFGDQAERFAFIAGLENWQARG